MIHYAAKIRRDIAVAVRAIRRAPTFAFATIAILGLGIGMSTSMFAIYTTVLADQSCSTP